MKILLLIVIIIIIIYYNYRQKEYFTDNEIKNYNTDLLNNCVKSKDLLKQLIKNQKLVCNSNNINNKENINLKTLCYNDTSRLIFNEIDINNTCK